MIYCVEDDDSIRELVVYTLQSTGFSATGFACGKDFFQAINAKSLPELILLDLMLPDEDGISILKQLRGSHSTQKIPIIIATAKNSEYDKVIGLDSGADDYLTKPFGMMEMVSRVKAVLRRSNNTSPSEVLTIGCISLDTSKHFISVSGIEIILTFKEFELLQYLMQNRGIVLSRDKILETIWGYDFDGETRTVDVHIRTLRQKLGENASALIETIRGVGYRIS